MATIEVQKVDSPQRSRHSRREMFATVCYYYPQYSLKQVARLPYRDVNLLLQTAQKIRAVEMYNLTLIAQAPHSKKQANVKKLIDYFKKIAGI